MHGSRGVVALRAAASVVDVTCVGPPWSEVMGRRPLLYVVVLGIGPAASLIRTGNAGRRTCQLVRYSYLCQRD